LFTHPIIGNQRGNDKRVDTSAESLAETVIDSTHDGDVRKKFAKYDVSINTQDVNEDDVLLAFGSSKAVAGGCLKRLPLVGPDASMLLLVALPSLDDELLVLWRLLMFPKPPAVSHTFGQGAWPGRSLAVYLNVAGFEARVPPYVTGDVVVVLFADRRGDAIERGHGAHLSLGLTLRGGGRALVERVLQHALDGLGIQVRTSTSIIRMRSGVPGDVLK
jgi:hypothetical protein